MCFGVKDWLRGREGECGECVRLRTKWDKKGEVGVRNLCTMA